MREIAQFVGWGWVVFNGIAALYGLVTQGSIEKGLLVTMICIAIGSPGLLLILWGRRTSSAGDDRSDLT